MTQVIQKTLEVILNQVSYIHYPTQFQKDNRATIQALINKDSEINVIILAYVFKLGFKI